MKQELKKLIHPELLCIENIGEPKAIVKFKNKILYLDISTDMEGCNYYRLNGNVYYLILENCENETD
jgi:hypothetical protein